MKKRTIAELREMLEGIKNPRKPQRRILYE